MSESKPDPGRALREEKQQMFADQERRRDAAKPTSDAVQLQHAKSLLAKLEEIKPNSPSRIILHGPPAGAMDDPPTSPMPERLGGCFADIADDDDDTQERKDDDARLIGNRNDPTP